MNVVERKTLLEKEIAQELLMSQKLRIDLTLCYGRMNRIQRELDILAPPTSRYSPAEGLQHKSSFLSLRHIIQQIRGGG